jgi:hypothetical protein
LQKLDALGHVAVWTAAQESAEQPWEGFASAHTWIYAEHGWWHLVPRPADAPAPAGGARLGFNVPCYVLTAYNPDGRAAAEADNRAAARALRADPRLHGLVMLSSFGGHPDRVVACDSDHVVAQAVVCHRGQPPTPTPSSP